MKKLIGSCGNCAISSIIIGVSRVILEADRQPSVPIVAPKVNFCSALLVIRCAVTLHAGGDVPSIYLILAFTIRVIEVVRTSRKYPLHLFDALAFDTSGDIPGICKNLGLAEIAWTYQRLTA